MQRITTSMLDCLIKRINQAAGMPLTYSDPQPDGKSKANPGHYHLDSAYGGYKLVRTCSEGSGTSNVSTGGYTTKAKLYNELQMFLNGLLSAKNHTF